MSASGTKQTSRHVRSNVANGVKADIIGSLRISAFDPEQTLVTEIAALLVVPRNGRQPRTGWPFRCSVMLGWRIGPWRIGVIMPSPPKTIRNRRFGSEHSRRDFSNRAGAEARAMPTAIAAGR